MKFAAHRSAQWIVMAGCLGWFPGPVFSEWSTLKGCRLHDSEFNDGDSFHVVHESREYIFRLYFVDAPETEATYPSRVREQATYFKLSDAETLALGVRAARFTAQFLRDGFTVVTRWQSARGNSRLPRYYAFVRAGQQDLAEALVANGMARNHGVRVDGPGRHPQEQIARALEKIEDRSRRREPLDEAALPAEADPAPINLNTASLLDLARVPGIGMSFAGRVIQGRPYEKVEDLSRAIGLASGRRLEDLRRYVTVQ